MANSTFKLYTLFFKIVGNIGMIPYSADINENANIKPIIKTRESNHWSFKFFIFNIWFAFATWFLRIFMFLYKYQSNFVQQEIPQSPLVQLTWISGYSTGLSVHIFFLFNYKEIREVISCWIQLEKFVDANIPADSKPGIKSRKLYLRVQYIFGAFTSISCTISIAGLLLLFPQFPVHFRTIFNSNYIFGPAAAYNTQLDSNSWNNCLQIFATWLLRVTFNIVVCIIEVYEHFIVWSILASFDTLLSMSCRCVTTTLRRMEYYLVVGNNTGNGNGHNGNSNLPHLCFLYRQLIIHVKMLERIFGPIVFLQELVNLAINVFILYCLVTFGTESLMFLFVFIFTGIGITTRMFLLYMPMSNVYYSSISFRKLVEGLQQQNSRLISTVATFGGESGPSTSTTSSMHNYGYGRNKKENTLVLAELRTLRPMYFRPCGVHRITPSSINDYMLALFSNYYTVRKI